MDPKVTFDVSIIAPGGVLFEGKAQSVVLPGTNGVFEVLINHKPVFSRLRKGSIMIDGRVISILRGVVKAGLNQLLAIVESD